ncbi:MAG: hypothetical protein F6J87_25550 [Spirulina sp. SIO3F2]|nr:hypothetical protein [Spirulina sp. SIO3F2]
MSSDSKTPLWNYFVYGILALSAIAAPLGFWGYRASAKNLLALQAACEGTGVPTATSYESGDTDPKMAVIVTKDAQLAVGHRYMSLDSKRAWKTKGAQLVACVNVGPAETFETCRYSGNYQIHQQKRAGEIELVVAQTGEVLERHEFTAYTDKVCPESVKLSSGSPKVRYDRADGSVRNTVAGWLKQVRQVPKTSN